MRGPIRQRQCRNPWLEAVKSGFARRVLAQPTSRTPPAGSFARVTYDVAVRLPSLNIQKEIRVSDRPQIRVELRACAACGAVVVDQERHFDWHAAIREGAGRALDYRPDYELIGLVDAITEDDLVSGDEPPLTELYRSDQD